jgi:hypothetical protein
VKKKAKYLALKTARPGILKLIKEEEVKERDEEELDKEMKEATLIPENLIMWRDRERLESS